MKQIKLVIVIIIILLFAGGIFIGFNIGQNANKSADAPNQPTGGTTLNLGGTGLTKVGSDIYSQTNTTNLILSNNSIRTLPSEMGRMTKITTFRIDHNMLEGSLIGEIRQMSGLQTLDVSYNNMTGMPAEIGQLSKLTTLNYSYNNIDGLPNELANLKNNLQEFNLTGNPLSADKINKLKTDLPNTNIIF
ncbi:MAG: hypothetical protein WCP11_02430 [Candidatus Saccharibacteria bacterium]